MLVHPECVERSRCAAACDGGYLGNVVAPRCAWGALAERGLYERVPFEPGVLYDDIFASADLVPRLSEVVLVETALYDYAQRIGSICNPTEPDEKLLRDNLTAIRHFESAIGERLALANCDDGIDYIRLIC